MYLSTLPAMLITETAYLAARDESRTPSTIVGTCGPNRDVSLLWVVVSGALARQAAPSCSRAAEVEASTSKLMLSVAH